MVFADDTNSALAAAVALANSALEPDTMTTLEQAGAFYDEFAYTGRRVTSRAELEDLRALRSTLRTLLTSDRDAAVGLVNDLLARHHAVPRLVRHEPLDWHVHASHDDDPFASRVAVETAMAMVDVIRADEMSRLGVCADPECGGVVLDLSRNRSRRFCSTACGNRAAVAAYRARQAADRS